MKVNTKNKLLTTLSIIKVMVIFTIFFFASPTNIFAQDQPQNVEVKMKDGSTVIGELIEDTSEKLVVKSSTMGEMVILKSNILEYRKLRSVKTVGGEYWHENPNPTRNLYGPTGYGLRKGEGYYQNFMIFVNSISYGFTDRFTLGVGFEIVSLLGAFNDVGNTTFPGFSIAPKWSIPIKKDKWNVGVGALALHIPGQEELFSAGGLYGVSTWGSIDNNFSLGLAFGVAEGGFSARPTITIAGNYRVGRRFGLVTENWFVPADGAFGGIITFGGRYIGERVTWDLSILGLGGAIDGNGGFVLSPIPLIGATIPFGTGWK